MISVAAQNEEKNLSDNINIEKKNFTIDPMEIMLFLNIFVMFILNIIYSKKNIVFTQIKTESINITTFKREYKYSLTEHQIIHLSICFILSMVSIFLMFRKIKDEKNSVHITILICVLFFVIVWNFGHNDNLETKNLYINCGIFFIFTVLSIFLFRCESFLSDTWIYLCILIMFFFISYYFNKSVIVAEDLFGAITTDTNKVIFKSYLEKIKNFFKFK